MNRKANNRQPLVTKNASSKDTDHARTEEALEAAKKYADEQRDLQEKLRRKLN